mgnify:CR=1 FL=1
MSTNLRNIFGTVVHDVPSGTTPVELRQTFVTVVHNVPAGTTPVELRQTFGTVVHNVPDGTTPVELRQTFATVTSQIPPFSVYSADITGTIATSSMFSASVSGEWSSVPKTYPEVGFAWEFVSVPSGSQIAKILPLPDNSVPGGWTDMSDNTTLFHFNEDLSWSDPTTLNNITGSSALSNLGVWEGTLISGSDPANSTSSLGAYSGVEFFGNNKIVTSLTASQLGIDGAKAKTIMLWAKIDESASNDDNYIFSIGDETNKGMLGLRKINKNAFLPPGTPDQGNAQRFESYTGFDGYGQPDFFVPNTNQWRHWAVTYESGSSELVWYVDGEVVFVDPILSGNHSSPTSRTILNLSDTSVHMGGYSPEGSSNAYSFTGSLSEFTIFSSSLPQSQIRDIYNKQKSTGFYQDTWNKLPDNEDLTQWVDMSDNILLYHFDEYLSGPVTGAYQLPDNKVSGSIIDMTGNVGLWHLNEINVIPSSSTQIGSVGLVDSWGDGWHNANWVTVLVNSIVVVNSATLGGGTGPEWHNFEAADGDSVEVVYTSNGCGSPSWGSECSFILNSGSDGGGVSFYTSGLCPLPPATPYLFTANGFATGTIPAVTQSLDSSGNGFTGIPLSSSLTTGITLFSGSTEFTGAMDFDPATSSDIDFSSATATGLGISGNVARTTMLWAKADPWANNMNLFSMGRNSTREDWSLLTRTNGFKLNVWDSDLTWDSLTTDEKSKWIHIACVYDGTDLRLHINGSEKATSTPGVLNTSDNYPLRIGNGHGYNGAPWDGLIQEFAMFDRALSAAEILDVYNNQLQNTGDGIVIADSSGQGNDGFSAITYGAPLDGPFSGSTAWSGSGANQISIGNLSITGSSGLSFSTWINPTKNLTDEKFYVFDFTNGSNQDISLRKDIGIYGSGQYQNVIFEIGAGSVQSRGMFDQITGSIGGVPLESNWVHWVATADGSGNMSLYKDGELINSASGQGAIPDAIRNINYIGIKSDLDSAWRYDGELSEFAMWERELSAYEVQKIYQHQFSGSSVYNNYGVDLYSNSASFLPDVGGDYVTKITAYGSTAFGYATASIGIPGIPDCAGVIGGTAYTNSCGYCVEGTTGLPANYGQVQCWDGSWVCSSSIGPAVTGTCPPEPPLPCIETGSSDPVPFFDQGFVINNYKNLSTGRDRRVDQVPFKLGIHDKLGLRLDNSIITPSGSVPTYCTGS